MDDLIRSRMHEALDAIQPPPDLQAFGFLPAQQSPERTAPRLRLDWALGVVAALLALAIVAGLLLSGGLHRAIPSRRGIHPIAPRAMSGMVTPTAGWTIGPAGHAFRTTDRGLSWKDVTPAGYSSSFVTPYFFDANHAWITEDAGPTSTVVLRTSDGGSSWQRGTPFTVPGLRGRSPMTLSFLDSSHGWLLGASVDPVIALYPDFEFLYGTSDGGMHWQPLADTRAHAPTCPWTALNFSSRTTGWMTTSCWQGGGRPELLASHDGGTTWVTQLLPAEPGDGAYLLAPVFLDTTDGFLAVDTGGRATTLLATTDGGVTWSKRTVPGQALVAGHFVDPEHGWVIAGSSDIFKNDASLSGLPLPLYRTDDGGMTWRPVPNNLDLVTPEGRIQDLYFIDDQTGFAVAVGSLPYATGPEKLFETSDGGVTWSIVGLVPTQGAACFVVWGCNTPRL